MAQKHPFRFWATFQCSSPRNHSYDIRVSGEKETIPAYFAFFSSLQCQCNSARNTAIIYVHKFISIICSRHERLFDPYRSWELLLTNCIYQTSRPAIGTGVVRRRVKALVRRGAGSSCQRSTSPINVTLVGHRQLSVPDRELTKPIFGYFDGKLSSIASILINGLSYCLVKLHTSLSSIATLFYLE